ncbi:4-hydroxy-tetrahydrodipicolinate synthase [Catalinimonas alkaloidigena]|uniref:4-hydroxy-tetrahydrodipicolinate synthase n=1 Tax=Catalinimonas alkaloidigena TaxID=1075417 RepID=A0A1G9RF18_9BACT|nr:4-hydroxy-tetrahydrodipicolinate synthase [Catalinimonas alkaloidigena]SDM21427.1 4-hydroxy-tetrahydrodipicolinate synthase [Catalinimonas alkaloidigena]
MTHKLAGTGVALVTPFRQDLSIDFESLGTILRFTAEHGVNYYVVMGTTGEAATLALDEKRAVLRYVQEHNTHQLPLVYGVGGNDTQAVIRRIKNTDLTKVDALLCVSPYYNKPTQEGIYRHYMTIADASPIPVIIYNVPSRTASNVEAATTLRLAAHPQILGIKESCADLSQIYRVLAEKPDDFLFLSGDDMTSVPVICAGGSGVISVLANAFPEKYCRMVAAALRQELSVCREILYELVQINDLMYRESNPVGVKAALALRGLCSPYVRLPLVEASDALMHALRTNIDKFALV